MRLVDGGSTLDVHVEAPFHGDPAPADPVGPTWRLWDHEVVELFIAGIGSPEPYLEVELGPHGHHLVLQLAGRDRTITARLLPLAFEAEIDGDRWSGFARIPREYLPCGAGWANADAIHGPKEARRYLSWAPVPGDAPDFHRIWLFPQVALP